MRPALVFLVITLIKTRGRLVSFDFDIIELSRIVLLIYQIL